MSAPVIIISSPARVEAVEKDTDDNGFYVISDIEPGDYLLNIRAEGYSSQTQTLRVPEKPRIITKDFVLDHFSCQIPTKVLLTPPFTLISLEY